MVGLRELLCVDGTGRSKHMKAIRGAIRKRLKEFLFVGLQEDFERSCVFMFHLMGHHNVALRSDHSVDALSAEFSYFRKVEKPAMTPAIEAVLEKLVELDDIIYEEAKVLYGKVIQPPERKADDSLGYGVSVRND